ncbi:hypothetical protein QBC34DRAFT_499815 [Podospora aff. communis PSN243]|uniref:Zn(2)-C6 fungal-type domain-containing protein n=1 Tax=Podospora aff. communis PSN243 TaxID=3040156 RepID=A0AAV9G1V1_9PEZI|nr:hypothetical protein QBC34DRAFT_499815 [Podospora aff. communis PSN243]
MLLPHDDPQQSREWINYDQNNPPPDSSVAGDSSSSASTEDHPPDQQLHPTGEIRSNISSTDHPKPGVGIADQHNEEVENNIGHEGLRSRAQAALAQVQNLQPPPAQADGTPSGVSWSHTEGRAEDNPTSRPGSPTPAPRPSYREIPFRGHVNGLGHTPREEALAPRAESPGVNGGYPTPEASQYHPSPSPAPHPWADHPPQGSFTYASHDHAPGASRPVLSEGASTEVPYTYHAPRLVPAVSGPITSEAPWTENPYTPLPPITNPNYSSWESNQCDRCKARGIREWCTAYHDDPTRCKVCFEENRLYCSKFGPPQDRFGAHDGRGDHGGFPAPASGGDGGGSGGAAGAYANGAAGRGSGLTGTTTVAGIPSGA